MIIMVTTHLFYPSPKLKFKEAIGNLSSYLEHHDHIKEAREKGPTINKYCKLKNFHG